LHENGDWRLCQESNRNSRELLDRGRDAFRDNRENSVDDVRG
jgi:hypothetical protein